MVFGAARSSVAYGACDVSVPRVHRLGQLESPSIWRLEFSEDPKKHVVLLTLQVHDRESFFERLASRVQRSANHNAFVFVHGYNVSFATAARRTAQISYDLGFDGAPVFFSWPSQGTLTGYIEDESNIEWAEVHLKEFLNDFFAKSTADHVYLIAHSMGNRGLVRALETVLAQKPSLRERLSEVILTAPDIDAEVFKRDMVPALVASGLSVTLYASSRDKALAASKKIHGYPRAGESGDSLVVVPGLETIDATEVDTNIVGHGYYAETRSVLADMYSLVRNGERPDHRFGLRRVDTASGRYWTFKR